MLKKDKLRYNEYYDISSAVDGNVNAIEKILALYDPYLSLIHI